jgi:hypothetical protein
MSFVLNSTYPGASIDLRAPRIGNGSPCFYCGQPLNGHQPVLIFGLDQAEIIGAAHPECGYFDFRYAQFTLLSASRLEGAEASFLAHFYSRLVKLPGQGHPGFTLRHCLASCLPDYPLSLGCLQDRLNEFYQEYPVEVVLYPGDLETDFCLFLGEVKRAARRQPLNILIDFSG